MVVSRLFCYKSLCQDLSGALGVARTGLAEGLTTGLTRGIATGLKGGLTKQSLTN